VSGARRRGFAHVERPPAAIAFSAAAAVALAGALVAGCSTSHGPGSPDAMGRPADAAVDACCIPDRYRDGGCLPPCIADCQCHALGYDWCTTYGDYPGCGHRCSYGGRTGSLCIPSEGWGPCACNGGTCDTATGCCYLADGGIARTGRDPECDFDRDL